MGVYDETEEERLTAKAMEDKLSPEAFEKRLESNLPDEANDPLSILLGLVRSPPADTSRITHGNHAGTLFGRLLLPPGRPQNASPRQGSRSALRGATGRTHRGIRPAQGPANAPACPSARDSLRTHAVHGRQAKNPAGNRPRPHRGNRLAATALPVATAPVLSWLEDKLLARFGRHEAPVLHLAAS